MAKILDHGLPPTLFPTDTPALISRCPLARYVAGASNNTQSRCPLAKHFAGTGSIVHTGCPVSNYARANLPLIGVILATVVIAYLFRLPLQRPSTDPKAPEFVSRGQGVLNAWKFFSKRWEFYLESTKNRAQNFACWIGKYPMVGLTGPEARKAFFNHKNLSVNEGYSLLFGIMPASTIVDRNGQDVSDKHAYASILSKAMQKMLAKEKMNSYLPTMLDRMDQTYAELKKPGRRLTEPHDEIYKMTFAISMTVFGCAEISREPKTLDKLFKIYDEFKFVFSPTMILYPWLPTPVNIRKFTLLFRIWWHLSSTIKRRIRNGNRENDICQALLDRGEPMTNIIGIIMTLLFAGAQQLGNNAAWTLIFLAHDSKWRTKARKEVIDVANRHFPDSKLSLKQKLRALPLEAWESEFPVLDNCFKDSMRLNNTALTCFRRNMSNSPVPLDADGEEILPPGWYACYQISDLHLDPNVFPSPERWDPSRYEREEDKRQEAGFLGFGTGKHVCMGRKFAQLEQMTIIATFLATFDFTLVDAQERKVREQPTRDFERYEHGLPLERVFLRYKALEKA